MTLFLDLVVRVTSMVLLAALVSQFFNRKGERWHVRIGWVAGFAGFLALCAVLVRGYLTADQAHGALYPAHVMLAIPAYAGLTTLIGTGIAMGLGLGRRSVLYAVHRAASWVALWGFALSVALGIGSRFMR